MQTNTGKRTAKVRTTLTKRVIEALEPTDTSWIAWDDKLVGFGIRVHPGGAKSFIVNYRAGDGGRKAPNKRVVIGRYGKVTADQARRQAQKSWARSPTATIRRRNAPRPAACPRSETPSKSI